MKNPIVLAIAGLILFIVFLTAKLPAAQVIPRLPLPDNISISNVSGTIWNGQASQVIYDGLQILNVNWQLKALPLLLGRASFDVDAGNVRDQEQIAIDGNIALSIGGFSASDARLFAPTPLLLAQVQLPVPVFATGRFRVDIEEMKYQKDGCKTLTGTGQWLNGTVAGVNQQISLGNFEAELQCDNGPIQITTNPDNSLNLSGVTTIHADGKFSVSGKFKVSPQLPNEVHNAARFFGNPDPQGFYAIEL